MRFSLMLSALGPPHRRHPGEAARAGTSCQFSWSCLLFNIWSDCFSKLASLSAVKETKKKTSTSCVSSLPEQIKETDSPSGGRQHLPAKHLRCTLCRRGGECTRTAARGSCSSLVALLDLSSSIYLFLSWWLQAARTQSWFLSKSKRNLHISCIKLN